MEVSSVECSEEWNCVERQESELEFQTTLEPIFRSSDVSARFATCAFVVPSVDDDSSMVTKKNSHRQPS